VCVSKEPDTELEGESSVEVIEQVCAGRTGGKESQRVGVSRRQRVREEVGGDTHGSEVWHKERKRRSQSRKKT
jgi:hypothetical protein